MWYIARNGSKQGLKIDKSRLAELQPLAGQTRTSQYVVIMPIILACLMSFGIVRFIGMGTGNKSLYIFGGVILVVGMTWKQLGSVKGERKRLVQ